MSLVFGRYSARSGVRARGATERGSKPGQPCTHGINLGVKKRTSLALAEVVDYDDLSHPYIPLGGREN
eukprot:scaffold91679_cov57-Phaeocystis_antarctica.AAC.1